MGATGRSRSGAERSARTTAVVALAAAQNGTTGVIADAGGTGSSEGISRGPSSMAIPSVWRLLSNRLRHGSVAGARNTARGVKLQFRTPMGPTCSGSLGQSPAGVVKPSWCSGSKHAVS